MASAVARLWADRLESGKIDNFNKVPSKLKNEVLILLDQDGYEVLDDGTVVKKPEPEPEPNNEEEGNNE